MNLHQALDLLMNGGPAEKVASLLGEKVGGALASITGSLTAYHVTGTLKKPVVNMKAGARRRSLYSVTSLG